MCNNNIKPETEHVCPVEPTQFNSDLWKPKKQSLAKAASGLTKLCTVLEGTLPNHKEPYVRILLLLYNNVLFLFDKVTNKI